MESFGDGGPTSMSNSRAALNPSGSRAVIVTVAVPWTRARTTTLAPVAVAVTTPASELVAVKLRSSPSGSEK